MSKSEQIVISTDASFNEETGNAGVSAVLYDESGETALFATGKRIYAKNNTEAEMAAILYALEEIPNTNQKLLIRSDSQNAIYILQNEKGVDADLMKLKKRILQRIEQSNLAIEYKWIPREENSMADAIASLSARNGKIWARKN